MHDGLSFLFTTEPLDSPHTYRKVKMKPIEFKEQNVVFAKEQKPYLPLPAYQQDNYIIHCWELNFGERLKVLLTGKLWIQICNFKQPPQPIKPMVDNPFKVERENARI